MADLFDIDFTDNSDMTIEEFNDRIRIAMREVGREAEGIAKQLISDADAVDTGRLRNSITFATSDHCGSYTYKDNNNNTFSDASNKPDKGAVYIGTNVEYAPYIEFGHHSYAGVHYLRNAAANYPERYKKIVEAILKE